MASTGLVPDTGLICSEFRITHWASIGGTVLTDSGRVTTLYATVIRAERAFFSPIP